MLDYANEIKKNILGNKEYDATSLAHRSIKSEH
jgi:hypothetical protein